MTGKVPLMLVPSGITKKISRRFAGVGMLFSGFSPELALELRRSGIRMKEGQFAAACMINAFVYFLVFGSLFFMITYRIRNLGLNRSLLISLA